MIVQRTSIIPHKKYPANLLETFQLRITCPQNEETRRRRRRRS
jgi:hypothetical protein